MGKVYDITKRFSVDTRKRLENVKLPKKATVKIELCEEDDGSMTIMYECSNKKFTDTLKGREAISIWLVEVVLDLCSEDPMLITALWELIDTYTEDNPIKS